MKRIVVFIIVLVFSFNLIAHKDTTHTHCSDTFNLAQHFSRGQVSGHFRNFFMNTINEGSLKDYWTNAIGMSLHYESLPYKGFMFEMKGIFTFQTISADLNKEDPTVNKASKWERELYDVLDPENKSDLDRLEELFIHYQWKNSFLRYGRIPINSTPVINQRDGRMKPYAFEGFYSDVGITKRIRTKTMILHGASPRSTVECFQFNEAIGLNNNGFTSNGEKANYLGYLNTHYLAAQEVSYKNKWLHVSFWEFYFDKLFNMNWGQIEIRNNNWKVGAIGVHQFGHSAQSKLKAENQYYKPETTVSILSSVIQRKYDNWNIALARTDIFGNGRFQFPRELGRERFYTSITRSWAEGLGKAQITNLSASYYPKRKKELEFDFIANYSKTAGSTNYAFNKYGSRDYIQTVLEIDYNFLGSLKGLELDLLYVFRKDVHAKEILDQEAFNKTNFHQINLIVNVNF